MKKYPSIPAFGRLFFFLVLAFSVIACSEEDDDPDETKIETRIVQKEVNTYQATFKMLQKVNGDSLELNTSDKPYINAAGQSFRVSKLKYLISDITFYKSDGNNFTIDGYHFIDVANSSTLSYSPTVKVPAGTYNRISFKFGFDRFDNVDGAYSDLNSLSWGWPSGVVPGTPNLGGGYHFMQLEGQYDSSATVQKNFLTHMGTARNINGTDTTFEDNHFVAYPTISPLTVDNNFELSIVMNVEQWYENPYQWDFNVYNLMIMPNYQAQRKLNLNGPTVFTIEL